MYKLALLQRTRAKMPATTTARSFLEQHRRVEAYLRRLILIALRRKGVTYNRARSEAEAVYFRGGSRAFLDNVKSLLEIDSDPSGVGGPSYEVLERLWLKFCCPYRNKLSHGGVHAFGLDDPTPKLLLHVNRCFVLELDGRIRRKYKRDPLGHLKVWKLPKGAEVSDDAILEALRFPNSRSPMSLGDVRRDLDGTCHRAP